jgi:hypothetical protein
MSNFVKIKVYAGGTFSDIIVNTDKIVAIADDDGMNAGSTDATRLYLDDSAPEYWSKNSIASEESMRELLLPYREGARLRALLTGESAMPSAKWVKCKYNGFLMCGNCKDVFIESNWLSDGKWNYCPNCGAKLGTEVDEMDVGTE